MKIKKTMILLSIILSALTIFGQSLTVSSVSNSYASSFAATYTVNPWYYYEDASISSSGPMTPEYYGAVGDGVTDDSGAITTALSSIGSGGVLIFRPTKTYLIKNSIILAGSNKTLMGYGATIKRSSELKTTTTATVSSGGTSITVVSSSGFAIGDKCLLLDQTAPNGGSANGEQSNQLTISNIVGNVITVNSVTLASSISGGNFAVGAILIKTFDMFSITSATYSGCKIYGLTFDGNRTNNTTYKGWIYNGTMRNLPISSIVKDCNFIQIPNENLFVEGPSRIINNYAEGLNGSFCHLTNGAIGTRIGKVDITGNYVYNACQVTVAISGHNEGYITYSAQPTNTVIEGNHFWADATYGAGLGKINSASPHTLLNDNWFYGLKGVFESYSNPVGAAPATVVTGVKVTGNDFINCDFLYFSADSFDGRMTVGGGHDQINVSDNNFTNTRLAFESVSNLTFGTNEIYFEDGYVAQSTAIPVSSSYANAVTFSESVNVTMTGNIIKNFAATQSSTLTNGVMINATGVVIKSGVGVNTDYLYGGRNFQVSNNTITGFGTCIMDIAPSVSEASRAALSYQNMKISNNILTVRSDANGLRAAYIGPGVFFDGNSCYGGTSAVNGLLCFGTTVGKSGVLNGPIVTNNYFVGFTNSITVNSSGGAVGQYNAQVKYNHYTGTIVDNSGSHSTIASNDTMVPESIIIYNERENKGYY
jgi:hypothetical protein